MSLDESDAVMRGVGGAMASGLVAARLLRAPGESARGAARGQSHRQRVPASHALQVSVERVYPVLHGHAFKSVHAFKSWTCIRVMDRHSSHTQHHYLRGNMKCPKRELTRQISRRHTTTGMTFSKPMRFTESERASQNSERPWSFSQNS